MAVHQLKTGLDIFLEIRSRGRKKNIREVGIKILKSSFSPHGKRGAEGKVVTFKVP
jgi:hypothetical protein